MSQEDFRKELDRVIEHQVKEFLFSDRQLKWIPEEIGEATHLERLVLDKNDLTELPPEIGNLTNLRNLELNNNKLQTLPQTLFKLTRLKILGLKNNSLTALTDGFSELLNLTSAGLDNNFLTRLPVNIGRLSNLESLGLANNELTGLPDSIGQLNELIEMDLSDNNLAELPAELTGLRRLEWLGLGFNRLATLPDSVVKLGSLAVLVLDGNQLTSLPSYLGLLRNLEELSVQDNQLTEIRKLLRNLEDPSVEDKHAAEIPTTQDNEQSLPSLGSLKRLDLSGNQLKKLPKEICRLASLEDLILDRNELTALPPQVGQLDNLQRLRANNNGLRKLPSKLADLKHLVELSLDNNELATFSLTPENFAESLLELRLANNSISAFPRVIEKLACLEALDLTDNHELASVPKLSLLSSLRTLALSENGIAILELEFQDHPSLETLLLSNNELLALPDDLGNAKALRILEASCNHLESLPESISQLSLLQVLDLHNNAIRRLPSLKGLKSLVILDLSENQLSEVASEFDGLASLSTLKIDHNRLATLPPGIGTLSNLEKLSADYQRSEEGHPLLSGLPADIGNLRKLKVLSLAGNRLQVLPAKLVDLGELSELVLDGNPIIDLPDLGLATQLRISARNNPVASRPEPRSQAWVAWLEKRPYPDDDRESKGFDTGGNWGKAFERFLDPSKFGSPAISVRSVRLQNIKGFGEMTEVLFYEENLERAESNEDTTPQKSTSDSIADRCTLFLGDNASGKTTIIKAIAIALLGPALANRLEPSPDSFLRHHATGAGTVEVTFGLRFQEEFRPAEFVVAIEISEGAKHFTAPELNDRVNAADRIDWIRNRKNSGFGFFCAYGSTRFFSRDPYGVVSEDPDPEKARAAPLFDPGRPMINPSVLDNILRGNLANLPNARGIEISQLTASRISRNICKLLPGTTDHSSEGFKIGGESVGIEELSDGLATQLGVIGHLARHLLEASGWDSKLFGLDGIVLIDEIEIHLHPKWERTVARDLMAVFPNIQFILSSHSPLVAASVPHESIRVLHRKENEIAVKPFVPDIMTWPLERILRSSLFDLRFVGSVVEEEWTNEYKELLLKDNLTEEEDSRFRDLSVRLEHSLLSESQKDLEREIRDDFKRFLDAKWNAMNSDKKVARLELIKRVISGEE